MSTFRVIFEIDGGLDEVWPITAPSLDALEGIIQGFVQRTYGASRVPWRIGWTASDMAGHEQHGECIVREVAPW